MPGRLPGVKGPCQVVLRQFEGVGEGGKVRENAPGRVEKGYSYFLA